MKKCVYCGKLKPLSKFFKTSRKNGYTARCKNCHGLGNRDCAICGKSFVGVKNKKLCSEECRKKSRPKTFYKCEQCGKVFGPIDHLGRRFCSMKCKVVFQTGLSSNKKNKKYSHLQRARVAVCPVCKKEFRAVSDYKDRKQIYCSHRCYLKNRRVSCFENQVGEYLEASGLKIVRQFRAKRWCFDFKLKGQNVLVEADGTYWHSTEKVVLRDKRKSAWCRQNGYELYRIDELEFKENKKRACFPIIKRWEEYTGKKAELQGG